MKKLTTLAGLVISCPFLANAQAAGENDYGALIVGLFLIAVAVVLFMLFRQVMIWYWKVDVIIKNQEDQTRVLKAIYMSLEEIADNTKDSINKI